MAPHRELLGRLIRGEFPKIFHANLVPYLRDVQDNISRISDLAETYRESLNNTLQLHLNIQQSQVNSVIKVLTVLATLSFPIVAITGFYGMNFPFSEYRFGDVLSHCYVGGIIALTVLLLYIFLKKNDWL